MGNQPDSEWPEAIRLLVRWISGGQHLDDLLDHARLGRDRWLVMETFRSWWIIERILEPRLRRRPRPLIHCLLRLAVAELLDRGRDDAPKVVHHAVEVARQLDLSRPETGFVNGVLRGILREPQGLIPDDPLASHPDWLVSRWNRQFGAEGTRALIEWNQSPPELTVRAASCPPYAKATEWAGYFRILPGRFSEAEADLSAGRAYVQDPFAAIPVELLGPQAGERIIDLCAAPGGKTRLLAESLSGKGHILAVDRTGPRLERLRENVTRMPGGGITVFGCNVEDLDPGSLPGAFRDSPVDAILIDVPCSNTGVIRKRPDVKVRLVDEDIVRIAGYQFQLLEKAAQLVRPGGRLVYSTCSLEVEENEGVVARFCHCHPDWRQGGQILSQPWNCRHDGGGAFLLTRQLPR